DLALMCARMFPKESNKVKKYVGGLPDMIYGSVKASKPRTMQDAIEFATELIDKKISTFGLVRRNLTEDLNLYAPNATITMMGNVLLNVTSATELAIWPETVGGHFKKDCPKLKNKNQGNQAGVGNIVARAYVVGAAKINPNANVITVL
ncbi:hypothetical protein Tco_0181147, partial [Tanacetum coccineum]